MKFILLLLAVLFLSACGLAPTQTSEVSETSEVLTTLTPIPLPPTETPAPTITPTPTPAGVGLEQLKAMTGEQKLALAPQPQAAPDEVVAAFLPGKTAKDITWGEKSLTFWERVAAYPGTTADGESVTLYYDLESGQWAKKYDSFEQVSQIAADRVPDVLFLSDRLIRNKLQYDYDWISQPQAMIDGKMVFRDEKGYPKAVFDTVGEKWLTPEEADVLWTWDKWKKYMEAVTYTGDNGKTHTVNMITSEYYEIVTDPNVIMSMEDGSPFFILNPSGIITVGGDRNFVIARLTEGATIFTSTLKVGL